MHIVLAGPGALGCLLSSRLLEGRGDKDIAISLLDHNIKRAEQICQSGIVYERAKKQVVYALPVFSDPSQIKKVDVLFLCVKSYDVEETLKFCAPLLGNETLLIFMQNGIGHLGHTALHGKAHPLFGTTTEGATNLTSGHVLHAGSGTTYLGPLLPLSIKNNTLLENVIGLLNNGGIETFYSKDIYSRIWLKLFINVGINALTVIHNCKNGELLRIPQAKQQMAQAIAEAEQISEAEGVKIIDPLQRTIEVCRATDHNVSSMLQDIRLKRSTEIDAINGAIVRMANKHGIATPVNSYLVNRINEIENYEN